MQAAIWQPEGESTAELLANLNDEDKNKFLLSLSNEEKKALLYNWQFWARPKQLAPPNNYVNHKLGWKYWLILAGRFFGKTRLAAEMVKERAKYVKRIALVAPKYSDVEKIMIYGESGIINLYPPSLRPKYVANKKTLYFKSGAIAEVLTGQEPESFRGGQYDFAWLDEAAAYDYLDEVWDLFVPSLRLGGSQCIITTTPKPKKVFFNLLENPRTVLTQGSSSENVKNIAAGVLEDVKFLYGDTDFAAQELEGQLLGESSDAIFKKAWLNNNRVLTAPTFSKIIVAVDPSGSGKDTACECGIMVAGLGTDGKGYLIKDYSIRTSPENWIKIVQKAFIEHKANYVVYEANYGGGLVEAIFRTLNINIPKKAVHATAGKDKSTRAQPIAALTQKGQIRLIGNFPELEMQLTTWTRKDKSPDRMDSFVWAFTEFFDAIPTARGMGQLQIY